MRIAPVRVRHDGGRARVLDAPRVRRHGPPRRAPAAGLLPPLPPVAAPVDGRHGPRRDTDVRLRERLDAGRGRDDRPRGSIPGSALVFMLTGPATNASTIAVVARMFGRRFVAIYLGSIFGVAIASGLAPERRHRRRHRPRAGAAGGRGPRPLGAREVPLGLRVPRPHGLQPAAPRSAGRVERAEGARAGVPRPRPARRAEASSAPRARDRRPRPSSLLLWARSAFLVVRPGETGLVRTLGRVTAADLGPGLHVVPPFPFGDAEAVPDRPPPLRRGRLPLSRRGGRFRPAHVPRLRPGAVVAPPGGGAVPDGRRERHRGRGRRPLPRRRPGALPVRRRPRRAGVPGSRPRLPRRGGGADADRRDLHDRAGRGGAEGPRGAPAARPRCGRRGSPRST